MSLDGCNMSAYIRRQKAVFGKLLLYLPATLAAWAITYFFEADLTTPDRAGATLVKIVRRVERPLATLMPRY